MKKCCYHYFLTLIILCLFSPLAKVQAFAADQKIIEHKLPEVISDFKTCAIVGLQRAPELQRSKMEIDIRRLDEDDSRWSYVPTLQLSSNYYVTEKEASISFNAVNYRPWEPYYSLQARELITQIVTISHIKITAEMLRKLADTLLEFFALSEIDVYQKEIRELHEKKLKYVEKRQNAETATSVEYEIEKQTLDHVIKEWQGNKVRSMALMDGLCIAMNLPNPDILKFDQATVLTQVLGSSEIPDKVTISKSEHSFDQQIMNRKRLLQKKKILLAYSQYLPDFSMGVRSPDVLNVSIDADNDYFFYVGMSMTLWDGKKRSRDITRQELLLRQLHLESKEVENNDDIQWLQAFHNFNFARSEFDLSQSVVRLKSLEVKKKESAYNQGVINLPELIDQKVDSYREKINMTRNKLALQRSWLQLRHLSGQLLKDTINVFVPQIPYD